MNHVFISYRHESAEHARAVRRLGEELRRAKIPVALDQFYLDEHPGGPDEGWPRWCEHQATKSDCMLVMASLGWFAAYEKNSPGVGLGAATEADLFRQQLFDGQGINERLRLVYLHDLPRESVPERLRAWHPFRPLQPGPDREQLVRWLGHQLGLGEIRPAEVSWPPPIEGYRPNLADRTEKGEWPAIVAILSNASARRIVLVDAPSGYGKSALVRETEIYAQKLGIPVSKIDFKGDFKTVGAVLGQLDADLGALLPTFSRQGADKSHLLQKDLRASSRPLLLILDSYEIADKVPELSNWVTVQLLPEVESSPALAVVVAGQSGPNAVGTRWRDQAQPLSLGPIVRAEHWEPWLHLNYPAFARQGIHVETLVAAGGGVPGIVQTLCERIAKGPAQASGE